MVIALPAISMVFVVIPTRISFEGRDDPRLTGHRGG
jgi:hypothetical protein